MVPSRVKMKSSVLYTLISLSGMVFGAEIVASHITQSIVLLLSAYHMLYNILSLLLLVISHRMSKGKTLKNTFGWARVKVLGLLVNMLFLGALCFAASVSAVQTMVHASHEDTTPMYPMLMVILGIINFSLNILCFLLIGGYTHHQGCSMIIQGDDVQMNCVLAEAGENPKHCVGKIPSTGSIDTSLSTTSRWCNDHQILDVLRDVSSCLTVIACGSVILLLDGLIIKYADAILAFASIIVLLSTTYPFVRESGLILLQSIPNHIDVNGLTKRLTAEFPDLLNVHDLHVWRLTTSEVIATVHIILSSSDIYPRIEGRLNQFFLREGISSATIQPEFANGSWSEKSKQECILQCSVNNNCGAFTCCGPISDKSKQNSTRCRISSARKINDQKVEPLALDNNIPEQNMVPQYDFNQLNTATETTL
ncbi:proton-coupled zinc antiporter SLC30A1-like isoform X2 [Argiope bruennichi]|uniref:proton-coupled zinc antiporter SLC30A1-like isoform X2 n=1 Tax=Argiope bruennichi TaxID=94029 RepID=UPI00249567A0|nr:proton-coupled zinc antiporter SLC30A1-like isoform X2 [Argiope bruennichi]